MNKFLTILAISIFVISTASAAEQPLARIQVCNIDGSNCYQAKENEYIKFLACQKIVLKSVSYDTSSARWFLDGKPVIEGNTFETGFSTPGYKLVTLNAANGELSHNMSINLVVKENKAPNLEEVEIEAGSDKKKYKFEPRQQDKNAETAINFSVFIRRKYISTDDQLTSKIIGDLRNVVIVNKPCNDNSCGTEMNFSATGTYHFTFEDSDTCGQTNSTKVEIKVFQNRPLGDIDIFGNFSGESSVSLSGKDPKKNDLENEIVRYDWNVTDRNGKIIKNIVSKSPEFFFGDEPERYSVILCATDRFGETACSEPHDVSILGLETRKADPTATLPDAEIYQNITLNATRSKPLRFIDLFEWRMCYLDKGQCRDEKIFRNSLPLMNISVDRSGEYRAKLRIYVGNKTDESSEFHIKVKSASEKIPANIISTETPIAIKNITESNASEIGMLSKNETQPAIPALGILPALAILCLVWYVNKGGRK